MSISPSEGRPLPARLPIKSLHELGCCLRPSDRDARARFPTPTQVRGGLGRSYHSVDEYGEYRKTKGSVQFSVNIFQEPLGSVCCHLDKEIRSQSVSGSTCVVVCYLYRCHDHGACKPWVGSTKHPDFLPVSDTLRPHAI